MRREDGPVEIKLRMPATRVMLAFETTPKTRRYCMKNAQTLHVCMVSVCDDSNPADTFPCRDVVRTEVPVHV